MTKAHRSLLVLVLALPACGAFLGLSGDDDDGPVSTGDPDAGTGGPNVADANGTNDAPLADGGDAATTDAHDAAPTERFVFITSTPYTGDLGGLFGADQKCNQAANQGSTQLKGRSFVAYVSVEGPAVTTVTGRVEASGPPFRRLDGTLVAGDTATLLNGPLLAPINITEHGVLAGGPAGVWTGTDLGGTPSGADCNAWAEVDGPSGTYGVPALIADGGWVNAAEVACTESRRLYCIERIKP